LRIQQIERKRRQKEEGRLAKEVDFQLQKDLKQATKGKEKPPRSTTAKDQKDIIEPATDVVEVVPPTVNHRGRQIRLPHRLLAI
jgi:hypothetical protein